MTNDETVASIMDRGYWSATQAQKKWLVEFGHSLIMVHRRPQQEAISPNANVVDGGTYQGAEGARKLEVGEDGIWVDFHVFRPAKGGPYLSEYRMTVCYDSL